MAYNPYSPDQIKQFIADKGIGSNPYAIHNYASQYNVDPSQLDTAMGWAPNTAQNWRAQNIKPGGPHDWQTAQTDPHKAYALATANGWSAEQADKAYGLNPGQAAGWAQEQGFTGGMQYGGMGPQPNSGAAPAPVGGAAPTPPNPYLPPGGSQRQNPYLPPGSGPGADPRVGMPRQGIGGLMRYLSDNPSMLAMGNEIARGVNNNLNRNVLTGIRGNAMAGGTVGGSRQGVAEGLATGEAMSGLAGALANLYGNQYNQDRGYGLQSDALDFNIHRGNLSDMRQGQMDQMGFLDQMGNWAQQGVNTATQVQQTPFTNWNQFVGPASQMAGLGGSSTQNLQGNPWLGALGGYMAGSKFFGG